MDPPSPVEATRAVIEDAHGGGAANECEYYRNISCPLLLRTIVPSYSRSFASISRLVLFPLFAFICGLSAIAVLNHGTCCFDWRWRIHSRLPSSFICVRSRFESDRCPDSSCSCY
jgi:hypothetical protein